jgi:hypothetical protein
MSSSDTGTESRYEDQRSRGASGGGHERAVHRYIPACRRAGMVSVMVSSPAGSGSPAAVMALLWSAGEGRPGLRALDERVALQQKDAQPLISEYTSRGLFARP